MGPALSREQPFSGAYSYNALRTVTLHTPVVEYGAVVEAVRQHAASQGYRVQSWSPAGRADSVAVQFWRGEIIVWGVSAPTPDVLVFSVYWNGDAPDATALDGVVAGLQARLEPFGHTEVASSPGAVARVPAAGR